MVMLADFEYVYYGIRFPDTKRKYEITNCYRETQTDRKTGRGKKIQRKGWKDRETNTDRDRQTQTETETEAETETETETEGKMEARKERKKEDPTSRPQPVRIFRQNF